MVKRRTMILEQIQKNAFFFNSREYKKKYEKIKKTVPISLHHITQLFKRRQKQEKKEQCHKI